MTPLFKDSAFSTHRDYLEKALPWLALTLVLLLSLWLRARYLWVEAFSYDEGHWLMFGVLANAGYTPYSVTFVGIPPLALWFIQLGAKLFGPTLAARYPMMLLSLLGIAGLFLSFRPWRGSFNLLTGLLAAVFLSFDVDYFQGSGSIMTEVPAVSLALLSFILAQQYCTDRRLLWLVLSGTVFALSLALKLFMVFLPALVGLLILWAVLAERPKSWKLATRQLVVSGGAWLLGVVVPWAIFALIYDPQAMSRQIFLFRLAFRSVNLNQGVSLIKNGFKVGQMLLERTPLVVGAVAGLVIGWRQRQLNVWSWAIWLLLALLPLVWQSPLRERYAVMLLPPLAVLSSVAIVYGLRWLVDMLKQKQMDHWAQPAIVVMLLAVMAWPLITSVQAAALPASPDVFADLNLRAVQYVWQNTTEDDCIVTDDQRFAFATNRLVPAALSETAIGRLATGWLTVDDIIQQIEIHNCAAVVYADWRFAQYLPQLSQKLRDVYFVEIPFSEDVTVFTAKKNVTRLPSVSLQAQLGDEIVVTGIDLTSPPWQAGQEIRLATYWSALKPPTNAYKIFLQLRNYRGEAVLNVDHYPFPAPTGNYRPIPHVNDYQRYSEEDIALYPKKGMVPTNGWPVGKIIREVTAINLPATLPSGTYHLYLGLYNPHTLERLPVQSGSGKSDELFITSITVAHSE